MIKRKFNTSRSQSTLNLMKKILYRRSFDAYLYAKHLLHLTMRDIQLHVAQISQLLSWGTAIINRRTCWYLARISTDTRVFSHQLTLVPKWKVSTGRRRRKGVRECAWCARISEWTRFWGVQFRRRGSSVRYPHRLISLILFGLIYLSSDVDRETRAHARQCPQHESNMSDPLTIIPLVLWRWLAA